MPKKLNTLCVWCMETKHLHLCEVAIVTILFSGNRLLHKSPLIILGTICQMPWWQASIVLILLIMLNPNQ